MEANRFRFLAYNRYTCKLLAVSKIDFLSEQVWVVKPSGEEIKSPWQICDIDLELVESP